MKRLTLFTLTLIALLILTACGASININLFTADEVVSQTFTADQPHLVVEMFNGGIDVITGSDNAIKVDVTKRGGGNSQDEAQADLKNVEVTMTQDGGVIRIVARRIGSRIDIGNSGASAKLRVPNGATLEMRSSNGNIVSSGPVGDVTAETSNGWIDIKSSAGRLDLQTSNGNITANGGRGQVNVETSNGGIDLTADNVVVDARTSNGSIRFTGSLASGRSQLRTSNSSIIATLPASASFSIDAETSNSKITSDFAATTTEASDTALRGTVGSSPETSLVLSTSNGSIDLRKAR
jgi:DUF4097 and DUF4098 domain-containing protein YvlB